MKNYNKYQLLVIILACFLPLVSKANSSTELPDNIFANKYTGMATVQVPLYRTTQREIPLVVGLLYRTSGIKVNALPTWTGYDWELSAGGQITREEQMGCDEFEYPSVPSYFHDPDLSNNCSPDVFYFSFMGKSGRFFFGGDRQWHVYSQSNLYIDFDVDEPSNYTEPFFLYGGYTDDGQHADLHPQQRTIKGFTIMDEDGTKYIFGSDKSAPALVDSTCAFNHLENLNIDYSVPLLALHADTVANAPTMKADTWYLTKVIDRFGNTLYEFEYERGEFIVDVQLDIHYEEVHAPDAPYTSLVKDSPNCRNLNGLFTFYKKINYDIDNSWKIIHDLKNDRKIVSSELRSEINDRTNEALNRMPFCPYRFNVVSPVYLKRINMPLSDDSIVFTRTEPHKALTSDILYPSLYDYIKLDSLNHALTHDGIYRFFIEQFGHTYSNRAGLNGNSLWSFSLLQTFADSIMPFHSAYSQENPDAKRRDPLCSMAIRPLSKISLYHKGMMRKRHEFSYTDMDECRLLLEGINIKERDRLVGNYAFNYNHPNVIPIDVLNTKIDSWGYYNGNRSDCSPDEYDTKSGVLSSIKYPTGAVTDFKYSMNQYENNNKLLDAGGLRVDRITSYLNGDRQDTVSSICYEYTDGQLYALPQESFSCSEFKEVETANPLLLYVYDYLSVLPFRSKTEYHIGYPQVTEHRMDGSYSTSYYSTFSGTLHPMYAIDYENESEKYTGYKRGNLLKSLLFDREGHLVKETYYTYRSDRAGEKSMSASNVKMKTAISKDRWGYPCLRHFSAGSHYDLYYSKYDVVETKTVMHENGQSVTDIETFFKEDYTLSVRGKQAEVRKCLGKRKSREGDNHSILETFCFDSIRSEAFLNQFFLPVTKKTVSRQLRVEIRDTETPIKEDNRHYPNANNLGKIDQVPFVRDTAVYLKKGLLSGEETTYMPIECNSGLAMVPKKTFSLHGFSETPSLEAEYLSYRTDGQLETFQEKGQPMSKVFYDDYGRVVANVTSSYNFGQFDYNLKTLVPKFVIKTFDGKSVFDLPNTNASVYMYNDLGQIESITDSPGITTYCVYDAEGRLIETKDHNGKIINRYSYNIKFEE